MIFDILAKLHLRQFDLFLQSRQVDCVNSICFRDDSVEMNPLGVDRLREVSHAERNDLVFTHI